MTLGVEVEVRANTAVLAINRPAVRNAIDFDTACEIATPIDRFEADPEVRAIAITDAMGSSAPAWIARH